MKHAKGLLGILFFICTINSLGQDTTKVLFIGNSFTGANNLPNLFAQLSIDAGHNIVIDSHMPGGVSVGDIGQGNQAHMNNPHVYSLLKSNDWDYVVLQDNQGRFSHPYGQFPDPTFQSKVIEGHLKIRDSLLFYHPCSHMIWFGGFGTKNGLAPDFTSGSAMIDSIYQNYKFLNDTALEVIAPIGPAFLRIISGNPSINLWGADNTHPSLHGSFLTACVIYSSIFKQSPLLSSYNPGISTSDDSLLKMTGYQTTMDSIDFTGLKSISPMLNKSNDTLLVVNFQNCRWLYNNSPYPSNNCQAVMDSSGLYSAIVTDNNGCEFRTLAYEHNPGIISLMDYTKDLISLYPNPSKDNFILKLNDSNGPHLYTISTAQGELIREGEINSSSKTIGLSQQPPGMYILKIRIKGSLITRKIIKN